MGFSAVTMKFEGEIGKTPGAVQDAALEHHPNEGGSWEESGGALAGQQGKDGFGGQWGPGKAWSKQRQAGYVRNLYLEENGEAAERCKRNGVMTSGGLGKPLAQSPPGKPPVQGPSKVLAAAKMWSS